MTITPAMLDRTRKFEGTIPYMYLDTVGAVTVGTGHMIPDANAASRLNMKLADNGAAATEAQKKSEWGAIKARPAAKVASYYRQFTSLRMTPDDATALLREDMGRSETDLATIFTNWSSLPPAAREALVDMCFNLGKTRFLKFRNLILACKAGDWQRAADESHRNGIPAARNDEVRALFEGLAITPLGMVMKAARKAMKKVAKKVAPKKATAKKKAAKKPAAKKAVARKAVAKKAPARKTAARKSAPKKTVARKAPAKKATAKKTTAKKTAVKKTPARKAAAKRTATRKKAAPR